MPLAMLPMVAITGSVMSAWKRISDPSGPALSTMESTVMGIRAMWLPLSTVRK